MTKKLFLTMSENLYSALEKKKEEQGYMTMQELINELLRRGLFGSLKAANQNQGGRPRKFEFEDYFAGPPGSALKSGSLWKKKEK